MDLIIATDRLCHPGGAATYALTVAEHLARLGHGVTLHARELGAMADLARDRALAVAGTTAELPPRVDGVIVGVDRRLAFELAARYPQAIRVFVAHASDEIHLPPPLPGVVQATIAMSDRVAARAAATPGAGEVVRLRQPVDIRRFAPRGAPRDRPQRVLMIGNYHSGPVQRADLLRRAWADTELEWTMLGGSSATLHPEEAMLEADIVVGYGRSIVEAMACGRPAYVHDHPGTGGWVTPDSYAELEAGGFALGGPLPPPTLNEMARHLRDYRPELGRLGKDLVRLHHDARDHAAQVVGILDRHDIPRTQHRSPLRAMANLSEAVLRAELTSDRHLLESRQWFAQCNDLQQRLSAEHSARRQAEAQLAHERELLEAASGSSAAARDELRRFQRTRRYRVAQRLGYPLDLLRGLRDRR